MDRASLSAVLRWLAVGAVVAFVVVFAAGALGVRAVVRRIEQANNVQRVHRARALLARQAATRAVSIRELAWWTATWDYIDRPTTREAARFLKENFIDWLPRQYGDRFFGIWSLDRRRVFVWTDSGATYLAPLIEQPAHLEVVAREKSIGGLLADSGRLFLVSLSVVVRTEDQNATGPWHGYLATARPVTASLEREWGDGLQERIELSPTVGDEAARLGDSATTRTTAGDSVESRFALRDVFGHPAVVVRITGSRGYLAAPERWTMALIAAFALLGLVLIGVVWVVARHSVWRPLHRLARALQGMRASGRLASIDRPGLSRVERGHRRIQCHGGGAARGGGAVPHAVPAGRRRAAGRRGADPDDPRREPRRGAPRGRHAR